MSRMTRALARRNRPVVATVWLVMLVSLVVTVAMERRFSVAGRSDLLPGGSGTAVVYVVALLAPACVGSRLALIRPRNPAGWLFLALALSLCWNGFVQDYAAWGTLYHPGSLPAARTAAVYADGGFLSWIVLLTLIVLVTPTGSAPSPRWRMAGWAAAICGVVYYAFIPFRSTPHDTQPFVGMTGPFAGSALAPILTPAVFVALVGAHLALLAAVASFIVRIIHANREERRQLRWLLIPAIPFPFMVAGAWAAARAENHTLLAALGLGYLVIIPVAAGLAIEKRRLRRRPARQPNRRLHTAVGGDRRCLRIDRSGGRAGRRTSSRGKRARRDCRDHRRACRWRPGEEVVAGHRRPPLQPARLHCAGDHPGVRSRTG